MNEFLPDIFEAKEIVVGDTIQWLEYPPYRWAAGEVIRIKVQPDVSEDTLWIKCKLAPEHLPQLKEGDIARRKMDRLKIDEVARFEWQDEKKRDALVAKQDKKREKAVSAALRYYLKNSRKET